MIDSGANVHIFNNPNFLSDIRDGLTRAVNTTASRVVFNQVGRLYDVFRVLPLLSTGYYLQPGGIANLTGLSLLSNTNQIIMNIDVENAFYVFAEDGMYMKLA